MFFAKKDVYSAEGLFTIGHALLFVITLAFVFLFLKKNSKKTAEEIKKSLRINAIVIVILELLKNIFVLYQDINSSPNEYMPLYYCSIFIFAIIFSGYGKGIIKKYGDVFIATGGIVGGITYLLFPTTSLLLYPAFHFMSFRSFYFHGIMLYFGLLLNTTNYVKIELKNIKEYSILLGVFCIRACIFNSFFDSNLMFISKNFPGTFIEPIYNFCSNKWLFTGITSITQMTLPFFIVYYIKKILERKYYKIENKNYT